MLSTHRQFVPRQSAITPKEIALFPIRQVPQGQRVLTPWQPTPLRQIVPGQRVLMPRQPMPTPRQSAPYPKEIDKQEFLQQIISFDPGI